MVIKIYCFKIYLFSCRFVNSEGTGGREGELVALCATEFSEVNNQIIKSNRLKKGQASVFFSFLLLLLLSSMVDARSLKKE
jgi:hypothetical protein